MSNQSESPVQEAVSFSVIAGILIGVVCFVAALNNVPFLSPFLFWVAELVYWKFPNLNYLKAPQIPMLVSAAAVGSIFCILGVACAPLIARAFSSGRVAQMDRSVKELKKNRARIKARQRQKDDFTAY
jgi:hypothetical protein